MFNTKWYDDDVGTTAVLKSRNVAFRQRNRAFFSPLQAESSSSSSSSCLSVSSLLEDNTPDVADSDPSSSCSKRDQQEDVLQWIDRVILSDDLISTSPHSILQRIEQQHEQDCQFAAGSLAMADLDEKLSTVDDDMESSSSLSSSSHRSMQGYEWVTVGNDSYPLAIRSVEQPFLNASSIAALRTEAEHWWTKLDDDNDDDQDRRQSRFTYQRPGNYEVHVVDLSATAQSIVNDCLMNTIYPLIRKAFITGGGADKNGETIQGRLCVYDALIIRYNATEAAAAAAAADIAADVPLPTTTAVVGAGQPLHRDLGMVSVNIMLNEHVNEFVGGGTFFENQLMDYCQSNSNDEESPSTSEMPPIMIQPLKPAGPGHGLAHWSWERHAGSATVQGVRDILVLFITVQPPQQQPPPARIQNALLKHCRNYCDDCFPTTTMPHERFQCRIQHQRMAIQAVPKDGEAWQYLGMVLMEYADYLLKQPPQQQSNPQDDGTENDVAMNPLSLLQAAQDCLEQAAQLSPWDARVYNNLGLVLNRLLSLSSSSTAATAAAVEAAFAKAWMILETSHTAGGCDVSKDWDALALNYGLFVANQDRFADACRILERVAVKKTKQKQQMLSPSSPSLSPPDRIVEDAYRLWDYCRRRRLDDDLTKKDA